MPRAPNTVSKEWERQLRALPTDPPRHCSDMEAHVLACQFPVMRRQRSESRLDEVGVPSITRLRVLRLIARSNWLKARIMAKLGARLKRYTRQVSVTDNAHLHGWRVQ